MKVVDTVQVHVLSVPREQRLPHPKVQICRVHTLDANTDLVLDLVENRAETVYVPHFLVSIIQRSRDVSSVDWIVECDVLPKLALQVIIIGMQWSAVTVK